jgi:hypothetical protein
MTGPTTFVNPLKTGLTVVVAAVGEAEGARGAAAALACAGSDADVATLLVDVGGRAPRPALLASAAAQRLEERLTAHLTEARVAARGQVCHLTVSADSEGLERAAAAMTAAREATTVVHVPPQLLQEALADEADLDPTGVLLRADLAEDRPLVALTVRDLLVDGLEVAVLKRRLGWVAERRAFFGALPGGSPGSLPAQLVRRLRIAP